MDMGLMAVEKSWFAILNDQDIVEEVMQMPSSVEGSGFIKIPAEDQSLIGKRYNRETGNFEVAEYYYAEVDNKGIAVEIITSPTLQKKDNWIQIPEPDQSLLGKWYDAENKEFIDPPVFILAAHNTDEICYKHEDKWLSKKLDEMEISIAEIEKQQGPQGNVGPIGPQGPKGDVGAMGPQGPSGESGEATLKRNTNYHKGEIVESTNFPAWSCMECTISGTTAACSIVPTVNSIGQKYMDGSCEWTIRHKGELRNVGDIWMTKCQFNMEGYPLHALTGLPMLDCRICDGNVGTINMLNVFPMGTTAEEVGSAGGTNDISLSIAQMPAHAHEITAVMDAQGSHAHTFNDSSSRSYEISGGGTARGIGDQTGWTSTAGNHTHKIKVSMVNSGEGQAFDNRPAYVALAFVQKIY